MKMDNRAVIFPQTKTILNGGNVPIVQLDDIQAILNMRDVWKHILNAVNEPLTFEYWFKLNEYVARNMKRWTGGTLRIGKIGISDTDYIPPIPKQETVIQELSNIFNGDISATKKALNAFVWGVKGRFLGMETSVQA